MNFKWEFSQQMADNINGNTKCQNSQYTYMKNVSSIFVLRYQSEYHWEKEQKLLIEVLLYQKVLSITVCSSRKKYKYQSY